MNTKKLARRKTHDPQFHMMFTMVYRSIGSGEVSIQDWRDAVNLAYSEWHSRNIGPVSWIIPKEETPDV